MGKPTVELVVAGDSSKLTKAFGEVGDAAQKMSTKVDSASEDMKKVGKSADDLAEKAGTGEQRFIGFSDSITGTQDILTGFKEGSLTDVAMGFADLAGGLESFVIPAMSSVAAFMKGGLSQAMTFVSSHPLLITLGLLAAAFVLLWTQSETFRTVVINVFQTVGNFIKNTFGAVIDWVVGAWNRMVDFFANLPARIGAALGSLGSVIGNAFKAGINAMVDAINWFLDHTLNWLISRANDVIGIVGGGRIPTVPHVPKMHTGGVLPGAAGEESLFVGLAGERVTAPGGTPHGGTGGSLTLTVRGSGGLAELIQLAVRTGEIQLEAGGQPVRVVA